MDAQHSPLPAAGTTTVDSAPVDVTPPRALDTWPIPPGPTQIRADNWRGCCCPAWPMGTAASWKEFYNELVDWSILHGGIHCLGIYTGCLTAVKVHMSTRQVKVGPNLASHSMLQNQSCIHAYIEIHTQLLHSFQSHTLELQQEQ